MNIVITALSARFPTSILFFFIGLNILEAHRGFVTGPFYFGHHPVRYSFPSFSRPSFYQPRRPLFGTFARPSGYVAEVKLVPGGGDSQVEGTLRLEQKVANGPVLITGEIVGLKRGPHGFHVHMKGELGNGCKDAGGHFNPFMKKHGDPNANFFNSITKESIHPLATERHVGDLGNILTISDDHPTVVHIYDKIITLEDGKDNNIVGRAIVVHAGQDDLGRGGDEESTKTGNAGGRVACGLIERVRE